MKRIAAKAAPLIKGREAALKALEELTDTATWQLRNKWKAEVQYYNNMLFLLYKDVHTN